MTYDKNTQHTPLSWNTAKKEYIEKAFWLGQFKPGSSFTIVEDMPRGKAMRFYMKPNPKGGKAFETNLIRINDGFVEKDLEVGDIQAGVLFSTVPDTLTNLKGSTFVNDSGRWRYVAQSTDEMNANFPPKSSEISKSMEPEPQQQVKTINDYAEMLAQAVKQNTSLGITTTYPILQKMADQIYPNRALDLIMAAKTKGCISEHGAEGYRGY